MNGERQFFLDQLHALEDLGVEDQVINNLGMAFASYEHDLAATERFLLSRLGEITVADTVETARQIAANTLSEVLR